VLAVKIVAEKDWLEKRGGEETVEVWLLLSGRGPKDWAADLYSDSETAGGGARSNSTAQCWRPNLPPAAELVTKGSAGRPGLEASKMIR